MSEVVELEEEEEEEGLMLKNPGNETRKIG
jgi:hypothetical protein